jgi:hypothetical protein
MLFCQSAPCRRSVFGVPAVGARDDASRDDLDKVPLSIARELVGEQLARNVLARIELKSLLEALGGARMIGRVNDLEVELAKRGEGGGEAGVGLDRRDEGCVGVLRIVAHLACARELEAFAISGYVGRWRTSCLPVARPESPPRSRPLAVGCSALRCQLFDDVLQLALRLVEALDVDHGPRTLAANLEPNRLVLGELEQAIEVSNGVGPALGGRENVAACEETGDVIGLIGEDAVEETEGATMVGRCVVVDESDAKGRFETALRSVRPRFTSCQVASFGTH